jgi:hypothetical protein
MENVRHMCFPIQKHIKTHLFWLPAHSWKKRLLWKIILTSLEFWIQKLSRYKNHLEPKIISNWCPHIELNNRKYVRINRFLSWRRVWMKFQRGYIFLFLSNRNETFVSFHNHNLHCNNGPIWALYQFDFRFYFYIYTK